MKQQATNITWHSGDVGREQRAELLGQRGAVLWFTGLSGSGKSTLAVALENELFKRNKACYRLDGDNIRHGLNKDLGFTDDDRQENIRRIGELAALFADAGIITTASFISPFRSDRDQARELLPEGRFVEIYVKCGLDTCEQRDPKGLYEKARAGEITNFTGIDSPYEEPSNPEITIDTAATTEEEAVQQLVSELERLEII